MSGEVLVVGAGPTGLVMASELAARGIPLRIIDVAPSPSHRSKALAVQSRSLELFQKMRCAEELIALGAPARRIFLFSNGKPVLRLDLDRVEASDTPYPFVLMVAQAETERVLNDRLQRLGVAVEREVELVGFEELAGGVHCQLRRGSERHTVDASYLIGCDGAHSTVRKGAGLSFEGGAYEQEFLLADAPVEWERPVGLHLFISARGAFVMFPMANGCYRFVASQGKRKRPHRSLFRDDAEPSLEELLRLAEERCPFPMQIGEPEWLTRFRLHHRGVDRYRAGRVFVAGDAAHIHSPAGGQGMNTGIQDAYNLAWKLALVLQGRADPGLLDSYHAERHPVGRRLLQFTDRLFSALTSPQLPATLFRAVFFPLVGRRVFGDEGRQTSILRFVSQLGIRYRKSPAIAREAGSDDEALAGGPRAGDRAPDGPLLAPPGGEPTSLFSQMTGPRHCLLVFAPTAAEVAVIRLMERLGPYIEELMEPLLIRPQGDDSPGGPAADSTLPTYVDEAGAVTRAYGVARSALYLIRPDGHVAYRASGLDAPPLLTYLERHYRL